MRSKRHNGQTQPTDFVRNECGTVLAIHIVDQTKEHTMTSQLMISIESYNNTRAWRVKPEDSKVIHVYIDSMKGAAPFRKIAQEGGMSFEVIHQETRELCLFGEESTGLQMAGREILCNLYRLTITL
jgi:hypothetical protein